MSNQSPLQVGTNTQTFGVDQPDRERKPQSPGQLDSQVLSQGEPAEV